jgi:hypothetical protein
MPDAAHRVEARLERSCGVTSKPKTPAASLVAQTFWPDTPT